VLEGIAVSSGIAMGKAYLFRLEDIDLPEYAIDQKNVEAEIERFYGALRKTRSDIEAIKQKSEQEMPEDHSKIFKAHLMILEDPMFVNEVLNRIRQNVKNAEFVVAAVSDELIEQLSNVDNDYVKERAIDIRDVAKRVIRNLLGAESANLSSLTDKVIVIANDLSPSDTALMKKDHVLGFATNVGSKTSHTAIMARALEIPAVVGIGNITSRIKTGDLVIIDGNRGKVLVNPVEEVIQEYLSQQESFEAFERSLEDLKDLPAVTRDGHVVYLAGNIEIPEEIGSVLEHGARGIGLYRTEFLYIRKKRNADGG